MSHTHTKKKATAAAAAHGSAPVRPAEKNKSNKNNKNKTKAKGKQWAPGTGRGIVKNSHRARRQKFKDEDLIGRLDQELRSAGILALPTRGKTQDDGVEMEAETETAMKEAEAEAGKAKREEMRKGGGGVDGALLELMSGMATAEEKGAGGG